VSFDLRDYIVVFENIIPEELCDEVLAEYNSDKNWINTATGGGVNREIRRCDAINMSDAYVIQQKSEWETYRSALRQIAISPTVNPVWPVKPQSIWS